MEENIEKLRKFITENELAFTGKGSASNSDCCLISGYADFIGVSDVKDIEKAIKLVFPKKKDYKDELRRVFDFAYTYNYGNYWKSEEAKLMYKF